MVADPNSVRVYTVNGATAGSSSSLPDWLTRKREAKAKGKRAVREHIEGTIELIQGFEFPEASNRVKTTRDGHHVIATGTYKPQIRVWDLDQLSQKFERHSDAENVDFVVRELPCPLHSSWALYTLQCTLIVGRSRSSLMIGQNPYTSKTIERLSCTLKVAFIIGRGYLGLVDHWRTTSLHVTLMSLHLGMRFTD